MSVLSSDPQSLSAVCSLYGSWPTRWTLSNRRWGRCWGSWATRWSVGSSSSRGEPGPLSQALPSRHARCWLPLSHVTLCTRNAWIIETKDINLSIKYNIFRLPLHRRPRRRVACTHWKMWRRLTTTPGGSSLLPSLSLSSTSLFVITPSRESFPTYSLMTCNYRITNSFIFYFFQ